ncbi:hypothetical protein [Aquisphaera insulae]|uniref:hypothetical protein n=1 Tax=Aquisphaera insulae TaxID=2712864 RepID=UPI0013EADBA7|nr:hypothetical protein [Aquisphaera insulae]
MPVFAERMKDLTEHLRASIEGRGVALGQVHQATHHLLGEARTFMGNISLEHQHRAEELHEMLETFHDDLKDKVAEMRTNHRDGLAASRAEMRRKLEENRAARHSTVAEMRNAFAEARHAVADDLRAAGFAWREFTVSRHHGGTPATPAEAHHAAPAEEPAGAKPAGAKRAATKTRPRGRGK